MLFALIISAFTIAILKTVREWAGFGSQSTLSRLHCKLNVMRTPCNSEKRRENGVALRLCCAFSKGAGKMKKGKMKKMLIEVIPTRTKINALARR